MMKTELDLIFYPSSHSSFITEKKCHLSLMENDFKARSYKKCDRDKLSI